MLPLGRPQAAGGAAGVPTSFAELVPPSRIADALAELPRRPELLLFLRRMRVLTVKTQLLEARLQRHVDEPLLLPVDESVSHGEGECVAQGEGVSDPSAGDVLFTSP